MKWITFVHDGKPVRHIAQTAIADMAADKGWSVIYLTTGNTIAYKPTAVSDPHYVFECIQRRENVILTVECDEWCSPLK